MNQLKKTTGNELDELTGPVNENGQDVNVINKQLTVKVGTGSTIFQVLLWILGIIPGVIFLWRKVQAANYFRQLQQRIQQSASEIDNFLEQRYEILQNAATLVNKSVNLDKDVMTGIAALRSGANIGSDQERNEVSSQIDNMSAKIKVAFENYPDLKSHQVIADAMQQNSYLQKEITAVRQVHNDNIARWNVDLFAWPAKMIVAAKAGYTTRIPFSASSEVKQGARGRFFE